MSHDDDTQSFSEFLERIQALTGLGARDAARVAFEFGPEDLPSPTQIVDAANELGYDVEVKHDGPEPAPEDTPPLGPDINMNPGEVVGHVYLACPRVQMEEVPRMGKAPIQHEMSEEVHAMLDQLPPDISAAIVDVNVLDGKATFWVHDEANVIDRPIGPIDITRYTTGDALMGAFTDLLRRINKVLAADTN